MAGYLLSFKIKKKIFKKKKKGFWNVKIDGAKGACSRNLTLLLFQWW